MAEHVDRQFGIIVPATGTTPAAMGKQPGSAPRKEDKLVTVDLPLNSCGRSKTAALVIC
ncbi:hypothetical protein MGG_16911 [Pyricularia oryzae 70-15]|uniref:Uncharacterized protein n=2 Tax=Pyricularia oryzae TaxID=318829 RepID=G4N0K2_PYRO7|nr:uncharacterized protein MGG_16911 [Pyricularia oryzae 70-15]EHA53133.1 hypothetical protein MGG_16911 [Pyricularia oryzae 70-15]KAI7916551.1 hypothetical protein M9X92_007815 [Pyricularia oryzae]KAI7923541.1 hypothetical protein M0657_005105 [Pyricularia oryzae]QBZ59763.1 hypothetical protein PoMZ_04727 [Pyricularia oryzae]